MITVQLLKTASVSVLGVLLTPKAPFLITSVDSLNALIWNKEGSLTESGTQLGIVLDSGVVSITGDVTITSSTGLQSLLGSGSTGYEVVTAPGTISATTALSIILAPGGETDMPLPDGTDGQTKRIVNGVNNVIATSFISIACTNNFGNDYIDLQNGQSVDLIWLTEFGGWVITACNNDLSQFWD